MVKTKMYQYLGINGIITSPVYLEGIYSVKKYQLQAEENKKLTKDNVNFVKSVLVPEDELDLWKEV